MVSTSFSFTECTDIPTLATPIYSVYLESIHVLPSEAWSRPEISGDANLLATHRSISQIACRRRSRQYGTKRVKTPGYTYFYGSFGHDIRGSSLFTNPCSWER